MHPILTLFILAIPIACISWTVTHEEVFREPREYLVKQSKKNKRFLLRKLAYMCTCEYCFSHYVTIAALIITGFTLVYGDWRGYVVSGFSLVWIANIYMSLFALVRLDVKHERQENELLEKEIKSLK